MTSHDTKIETANAPATGGAAHVGHGAEDESFDPAPFRPGRRGLGWTGFSALVLFAGLIGVGVIPRLRASHEMDAKTRELKGKVANAGAKATTASRDSLTTVDTQRGIVQHDMDAMQNVGNDSFESAKSHLNADIDALEGLIDKANKEVSNMK